MSLLTALLPTADWNGPGWWVVFFPLGWFVFFFPIFFVLHRFAEGEIDAEEYRSRRATLAGGDARR